MFRQKNSHFTDPNSRLHYYWTQQLYREYEHALFTYKIKLGPAVIRLEKLQNKWGHWDPNLNAIVISFRLIREYSWDVVVEVLKHEIAHKIVADANSNAKPHGPEFFAACRRLAVADWAMSASGVLPEKFVGWKARAVSPEEERLLQRVEKLLALAGSSNEHEALLAMQRVQAMYAKYNLERIRQNQTSDMVYFLINPKKKRMDAIHSMVGSILAEHFFVRVIYGKLYDAEALCQHSVMELAGTRENVLMAEYVHGFLMQQTGSLWKVFQRATGKPARSKRSYQLGVLSGFSEKLAALKKVAQAKEESTEEGRTSFALLKRTNESLARYVEQRHPRLVARYWGSGSREAASFEAGQTHGKKLNLHRPISESEGNRGKLLNG